MGVWSIRRNLAIFSFILFCFDTLSDGFVGVDLIFFKCHRNYAISVFVFFLLPSFVYGWWRYSNNRSRTNLLIAPVSSVWYYPYAVRKLILAIKNSTDIDEIATRDEDEAKM